MSLPEEIVAGAIHHIRTTRYAQLASESIIVIDHLLTLDGEVELIWKSSWSKGKVLFLMNRYYAIASVIFNNYALFSPHLTDTVAVSPSYKPTLSDSELLTSCIRFLHWQCWIGLIACIISQAILQMRIYALYLLNKRVLALTITSFLITIAASTTILGTVVSKMTASASNVIPGVVYCAVTDPSPYFFTFWIPLLVFDTLLCGLALFKGYQTFISSEPPFRSCQQLISILIRDSLFYFLAMFAVYNANLLVWVFNSKTLLDVPTGFFVAFSCVLSNRIILNVREMNKQMRLPRPLSQYIGQISEFSGNTNQSSGVAVPDELADFEMPQLRSVHAES